MLQKPERTLKALGLGMKLKANYWETKELMVFGNWLNVETKRKRLSQMALKDQAYSVTCPEV